MNNILDEFMRDKKVRTLIEVSARHIHLSKSDFNKLFGKDYKLNSIKPLSQLGEFACKEEVFLKTKKGELMLRVVGPFRSKSQIEISRTESIKLGIKAPLRLSGDLENVRKMEIIGPNGTAKIPVIVALRHLHCPLTLARKLKLKTGQTVKIAVRGKRAIVFENVIVRVSKKYSLALHIDTDEGNASGITFSTYEMIVI